MAASKSTVFVEVSQPHHYGPMSEIVEHVTSSGLSLKPLTCRYEDPLINAMLDIARVPTMFRRNYEVRCDASAGMDVGGKGNGHSCGEPTSQCPGCGKWTELCEDHLFEQPDGTRVCIVCDGLPEFLAPAADAGDEYDAAIALREAGSRV
jgi:hypothetical protein